MTAPQREQFLQRVVLFSDLEATELRALAEVAQVVQFPASALITREGEAGALTYIATAAFAVSLGQAGWIRRGAARAFTITNLLALVLLVIRGLQFPDPKALLTPWYACPGFIVGIPAVPFIIPFLFGVVLLRCAGEIDNAAG